MAFPTDLIGYLQAQGFGTPAVNLFDNGLPLDSPTAPVADAIIAVRATGGLPPLYVHDQVGPSVARPGAQVIVRGAEYGIAETLARAFDAWQALGSVSNQTLSGTRYLAIRPMQQPFPLYDDDFQRPIVVFNVVADLGA
jgi:hypothetical protein